MCALGTIVKVQTGEQQNSLYLVLSALDSVLGSVLEYDVAMLYIATNGSYNYREVQKGRWCRPCCIREDVPVLRIYFTNLLGIHLIVSPARLSEYSG